MKTREELLMLAKLKDKRNYQYLKHSISLHAWQKTPIEECEICKKYIKEHILNEK
jgi:hypothetical protein